MQKHEGFFLIELLIYLIIFSFFIVLFMRTFAFTVQQLGIDNNHAYAIVQLYATEQQMIRELEKVPVDKSNWKCVQIDQIIWHNGEKDISWCFEKEALVHREGSYNAEKQQWKKKRTNMGAKNIKKGIFEFSWSGDENEQQLELISITIDRKTPNKTVKHVFCVSPRNKVLL